MNIIKRKPIWFKQNIDSTPGGAKVRELLKKHHLNTVCEEAKCPNRNKCYNQGNATFLIMGDSCTRTCKFCAISSTPPLPLDPVEPLKIAEVVADLKLKYAVITSVTRDDLPDGGSEHFAKTVRAIRDKSPECKVELLIPDFQGNYAQLDTVLESEPDVLNHNVETISRLYCEVRPEASYYRSLELLKYVSETTEIPTKSGFMLGLGENKNEVIELLNDLRSHNVKMITIGQYLAPSTNHYPMVEFIPPEDFLYYENYAMASGFDAIFSGPLVRSSYLADEMYDNARKEHKEKG